MFPKEFIVNETRLSVSAERARGTPASTAPSARVVAGSTGPGGSAGIGSVQVAGSGGSTSESRYTVTQLYNETQWTSVGRRHQWKVGLEALLDASSAARGTSAGRFEFASAEQFAANRPSVFMRNISPTSADARGVHLAAGFGDQFQPSKAWAWQYGVRVEGHRVRGGAANWLVDSIFGVRTGAIAMTPSISPMIGFTWFYGPPWGRNAMGFPSSVRSLVGGIRDYRGPLDTRSAQRALSETGLPGVPRELLCVGTAVPAPDWRAYEASSASIPDQCADGSVGSPFAQSVLPVSAYARDFTQGHSWRADLAWNTRLSNRLYSTLHGRLALNTHQPAPIDLNFAGAKRFELASEGNRPVFVSPESYDPASGATTATQSRRVGTYGSVTELRSDLRSRDASLTATLDFRPTITRLSSARALPFTLSYTFSSARAQSHGFSGTTAGDPRRIDWARARTSRHSIYLASALHVPDWARLTAGLRVWSGSRYTPTVLGDVNGDGRATNDRAFVFDARTTTDLNVESGMTALLAAAPSNAAACLRTQLGGIARANSCTGPWSATLYSTITLDPARVGLRNRGKVQIQIVNVLAALDQLVHGASGMRGWGQPPLVDPVLLRLVGFDPVLRRARYAVNRSFGDTRTFRNLVQAPFRVGLDASLYVGPDREREELVKRITPEERRIRLDSVQLLRRISNPSRLLDHIVDGPAELELTGSQHSDLQAIRRRFEAVKDSIYGALAGYLASREGNVADRSAQRRWHEANAAVGWKIWETGVMVRAILDDRQWARLFEDMRPSIYELFRMDRREAARMLAAWQTYRY